MKRNERTSARIAKIAGRILAAHRRATVAVYESTDGDAKVVYIKWSDIRALAASALTQAEDRANHATLRAGKIPRGHKLIKRHKPVKRRMLHK